MIAVIEWSQKLQKNNDFHSTNGLIIKGTEIPTWPGQLNWPNIWGMHLLLKLL